MTQIRTTQTYLINLAKKHFSSQGWKVLYYDLPGGRRSGTGRVAQINALWEGLYNLSPDILLEKNSTLLILEVNVALTKSYFEKFRKYKTKEKELIAGLSRILDKPLRALYFGFVSKKSKIPEKIDDEYLPFYYLYYKEGELEEKIFSLS